jgi:hypothetical protein
MVVGVTPSTLLIARRVHPNSATICSFVKDVRCCRQSVRTMAQKATQNPHPVGPCVNTNVMPGHVLFEKNLGTFDDAGSDNEKCSDETPRGKVV